MSRQTRKSDNDMAVAAASSSRNFVQRPNVYQTIPRPQVEFQQRSRRRGTHTIDGAPAVTALVKALHRVPKEKLAWMQQTLWTHNNKKRVRLQRVGGERGTNGRAYVIDRSTTVDGITRRMKSVVHDVCRQNGERMATLLANDGDAKRVRSQLVAKDKNCSRPCPNLARGKRCNPMAHGSAVHANVYHIIRHALHRTGLHRPNSPLSRSLRVDTCAHACIIGMIKNGLYPFSSEWPAFTTEGTGLATAADVLAFDAHRGFMPTVIELKTGSADRATDMRIGGSRDIAGNGLVAAIVQVALTRQIAFSCYKDVFSVENTSARVVYARSWGIVSFEVSEDVMSVAQAEELLRVFLTHGKTLRRGLSQYKNHQSFLTSNNKPRKRVPKRYKAGFDAADDDDE